MTEVEYDPDAGTVGYLTWDEWDRLTRAWTTAHKHLPWWWVAGHVRGGDADELKSRRKENPLPLPATWLAAHEITRLMQELNSWPELEDAAHDKDGAELALLLIREVQTAEAKWPMSDRSHRVTYFRCQACQQMTLKYLPPNDRPRKDAPEVTVMRRGADGVKREVTLLDVVVRCTDKGCNAVMDQKMFELAVAVILEEQRLKDAKRRVDSGSGGAGESGSGQSDGVPVDSGEPCEDVASGSGSVALSA